MDETRGAHSHWCKKELVVKAWGIKAAKPRQQTFAVERVDGLHAQLQQLLAKLRVLGHGRRDAEEMLVLALHTQWSSFVANLV